MMTQVNVKKNNSHKLIHTNVQKFATSSFSPLVYFLLKLNTRIQKLAKIIKTSTVLSVCYIF